MAELVMLDDIQRTV